MNRIRSLLKIERGEETTVLLLFLYLTLTLTSYIVAKAVRDALFLTRFSATDLPYIYIGVAVLIGFVVSFYVRLSSRLGQTSLISATLGFFILSALGFWWAARVQWESTSVVFYVWSNIFGIIITAQVWTVASSILDTRQAKRLFPIVASGGILGATAGGLIAATVVRWLGTENLLIVLGGLVGLCIVIVQILSRRHKTSGDRAGAGLLRGKINIAAINRTVMCSPHLRLITLLLALSAIVTLIVDFQFKLIVQRTFQSKDDLTAFFGSFYAYIGFFSFLLQFLAGTRISERYGIRLTLLLLPLSLLAGTLVLLAFPLRLWAGILVKGSDGALRYSIDKSALELLYVPVPQAVKAEIKAVVDMVFQRFADGVGGILLLLMVHVGLGLRGTAIFNLILLAVWLLAALKMRGQYVQAVRSTLAERQILPESALHAAFLDPQSIQMIRSMLANQDEEIVIYAMDVAAAIRRTDLMGPEMFVHSSSKVRLKALDLVPIERPDILRRLIADPETAIRVKAVARVCELKYGDRPMLAIQHYFNTGDIKLRVAAAACFGQHCDRSQADELRQMLTSLVVGLKESAEEWKDVAEALGHIRHPAAVDLHLRLLGHSDPDVRNRAIVAAGQAQHREIVPFLIRLLPDPNFGLLAREALQNYQTAIIGTLGDVLRDPNEDLEVRRQIPRILAKIPDQATVNLLLEDLFDDDGLLRFRVISALNKLRMREDGFHFDPERIGRRIEEESVKILGYERDLVLLYPEQNSGDLFAHLLQEKIRHGKERVFRLLALILPPTTVHAAHRALMSGANASPIGRSHQAMNEDRIKRSNAAEYLDNVLPRHLKRLVLPLVESKSAIPAGNLFAILQAYLKSRDETTRICARDAVEKNLWLKEVYTHG